MSFGRCSDCGKYDWIDRHRCAPAFDVWSMEDDDEDCATKVYAFNAEEAAREWADEEDPERDYSIVSGNDELVAVRQHGTDDDPQFFRVSGESVPSYSAAEVEVCPGSEKVVPDHDPKRWNAKCEACGSWSVRVKDGKLAEHYRRQR